MEPDGRLIENVTLENGLTLHIHDQSRPVAGDRVYVKLLVHVPVDVEHARSAVGTDAQKEFEAFAADFGNKVCFEQHRIKNFVDKREAPETLTRFKEELLQSTISYLSRPHFPSRFVKMRFEEWQKEQVLRKASYPGR